MSDILKSADEWLKEPKYKGIVIMDPDGWRHSGRAWTDRISEKEFNARTNVSTICFNDAWREAMMKQIIHTGKASL